MEKYRQGNYFANRWLVDDPKAIVVIAHRKSGCTVSIKDARYNIDKALASAIEI